MFDYEGNLLTQSDEHADSYEKNDYDNYWYIENEYRSVYSEKIPPSLNIYHHDGLIVADYSGQGITIFNENTIAFYLVYGFTLIGFNACEYQNNDLAQKEVRMEMRILL